MARSRSPAGYSSRRRERSDYRDDYDRRRRHDRREDDYRDRRRYEDDIYRPSRQERSPRRRSRSPRDRDYRREREEHRDRDEPRRRDRSREVKASPTVFKPSPSVSSALGHLTFSEPRESQTPQPTASSAISEEERKKATRFAKLEAWKKKQAIEKPAKVESSQPASPKAPTVGASSASSTPAPHVGSVLSPKPFVDAASSPQTPTAPTSTPALAAPAVPLATFAPIGFKKAAPEIKRKAFLTLDDDEEIKKRKIDKLPDLPDDGSLELANGHEEHENSEDRAMSDAGPAAAAEDEIDPLDAFMAGVEAEVQAAEARTYAATRPAAKATSDTKSPVGQTQPEPEIFRADDDDMFEPSESIEDNLLAITSIKKRRDVPTVDWKTETLSEFQKNFYTQSAEISALDKGELDAILQEDNIVMRGRNKSRPILRWTNAAFPKNVMDVIENLGFEKPTPIQSVTLPTLMSGRDCIAIAQTGSGKTLGYVLPMLRHIQAQPRPSRLEAHAPTAFILVPTRELAQQVYNNAKPFMKGLGLRMVTAYGGATLKDQIGALKIGADAVVCTPGRAIELLILRKLELRRVTFFVLDEADRMLDMGFEPQISKISANIRPDRQTSMFSATFPKKMQTLAEGYLRNPIELIVGGRSTIPQSVEVVVEVMPEADKFNRLMEILNDFYKDDTDARTLVFVEQQRSADDLLNRIMKSGMGIPCNSIYGSKPQDERIDAIADFKSGALPLLIATSVAARGLDIEQLQLVIQYDPANHTEDNIHRIGRTGRAGRPGKAITFISEEQARFAEPLSKALRVSERDIPPALSELVELHDRLVEAGKAEKTYGGFGGRGIDRLDKEHEEKRRRERQQAGFDEDRKDDKEFDEELEKDMAAIITKASGGMSSIADPDVANLLTNYLIGAAPEEPAVQEQKKSLIDNIKYEIKKTETAVEATSAPGDARSAAEIIAQKINSRLMSKNQIRSGQSLDNKGRRFPNCNSINFTNVQHPHETCPLPACPHCGRTFESGVKVSTLFNLFCDACSRELLFANKYCPADAGAFHATLEINDFGQRARWSATNRSNIVKLLEKGNCSITNKGTYYPKGKEPSPGDPPKLYILVEGETELIVKEIMQDLIALLKKGDEEDNAPANKPQGPKKYDVLNT